MIIQTLTLVARRAPWNELTVGKSLLAHLSQRPFGAMLELFSLRVGGKPNSVIDWLWCHAKAGLCTRLPCTAQQHCEKEQAGKAVGECEHGGEEVSPFHIDASADENCITG